jgi:hypothetical protein
VLLIPLNTEGWAVNSSFSNQKLYGFIAQIQEDTTLPLQFAATTYPANSTGVDRLLHKITCLQCRAVLLEWYTQRNCVSKKETFPNG